jgi:hypothetical protein
MRKWGVVVTALYGVIFVCVLVPGILLITGGNNTWASLSTTVRQVYADATFWIYVMVLVGAQAVLLFLSIDTSHQRLKPRTHIFLSGALATFFFALLSCCILWSLGVAIRGNDFLAPVFDKATYTLEFVALAWVLWGGVFYLYLRNRFPSVTRLTSWLLKGSVLELLVAVPCHVIVRRRGDCCAPVVTGFGIYAGLAVMLLSFGPGVLLLYKKRLDSYDRNSASAKGRSAGA